MENNYWMHRITCGENASQYAQQLLSGSKDRPEEHFMAIGWSDFSTDKFLATVKGGGQESLDRLIVAEWGQGSLSRNRYYLLNFICRMKKDDFVVVPLWDTFCVCRIADDKVLSIESMDLTLLESLNGGLCKRDDGYLYDKNGNYVDMGFYRKVEIIETGIPRAEYAPQNLYSCMKFRGTNLQLPASVASNVNQAILQYRENRPINLKDEIEEAVAKTVLQLVRERIQDQKFESLVEWYFKKLGAVVYKPAKNSCATEDGDADIIARFDPMGIEVMVQAKKHDGQTGDWATQQISTYAEKHKGDCESRQLWVISTCDDYSEDAHSIADEKHVRLVTGAEFSKMILEVGIQGLTL